MGKLGNAIEFRFSFAFSPRNLLKMFFPPGLGGGLDGSDLFSGTGGEGVGGGATGVFFLSTFVGTLGEFFLELRWKNPLGLK